VYNSFFLSFFCSPAKEKERENRKRKHYTSNYNNSKYNYASFSLPFSLSSISKRRNERKVGRKAQNSLLPFPSSFLQKRNIERKRKKKMMFQMCRKMGGLHFIFFFSCKKMSGKRN
jgi:hypothetical protein